MWDGCGETRVRSKACPRCGIDVGNKRTQLLRDTGNIVARSQ